MPSKEKMQLEIRHDSFSLKSNWTWDGSNQSPRRQSRHLTLPKPIWLVLGQEAQKQNVSVSALVEELILMGIEAVKNGQKTLSFQNVERGIPKTAIQSITDSSPTRLTMHHLKKRENRDDHSGVALWVELPQKRAAHQNPRGN